MRPKVVLCVWLLAVSTAGFAEPIKSTQGDAPKPTAVRQDRTSSGLVVIDNAGHQLDPISLEAYRAEFRYLKSAFARLDLAAPGVTTDGWENNIPEAEWPFMGFSYFGYSCANLAEVDPGFREEARAQMRWLIDALQTPRMTGFIANHFGEPFATNKITASAFVHGHFLNLTLRYRAESGDRRYDPVIHQVATALFTAYQGTDQAILKSYTNMWALTDNMPALSALSRYDRQFGRDTSSVRARFVESVKASYLDPQNGMMCTFIEPPTHGQLQGARGISQMYGLHFLADFAPKFAAEQFTLSKQHLFRQVFGFVAVREFPDGAPVQPDVASGQLVFGFGPSASGFAIAAAALNGDAATARQLVKSATLVGGPVLSGGELHYTMMPLVGQAVILFGKTELLKSTGAKQPR